MSGEVKPSFEFGPFRLDVSEHALLRHGRPVPLTPKVLAVLHVLVQNSGHLVEKDVLLKEVWPDNFVEEGALNRSVSVLRKALGETREQKYIETVPTRGYRFVAPVTTVCVAAPSTIAQRNESSAEETAARFTLPAPPPEAGPTAVPRHMTLMRASAVGAVVLSAAVLGYGLLRGADPLPAARGVTTTHKQVTFTGREGAPTLSPDGRRIAYVSSSTPERTVIVQELAGGTPLAIFAAPEAGHLRWSPDGSELLVWARGAGLNGVYIIPQLGGTPRLVAPGMYVACWSPDGSTIAVPSYIGGKIAFVDKQGTRLRTVSLHDVSWSIWDIDWSPVTDLLLFTSSDEQGRFTLWTVKPDGTALTRILTETTAIQSARWAPREEAIYYLRHLNQTDSLYKVAIDPRRSAAANLHAVTVLTGLETDQSIALSADGTRLVYARAPFHSNLWMLELGETGAVAKELTRGTSLVERPRISPDGQSIAFNMGHEPTANVYTMPIGGGPSKQLTFFDSFNVAGGWSADAKVIAFASTEGGIPRVWTVNAGGGRPRPLSTNKMSESFEVVWSPGPAIMYQQAGNRNYYQLDPMTGREEPLIQDGSVGWMFSPAYSPDGQTVAVMWNRSPTRGIWVVNPGSHQETPVYKTTAASLMPIGWSSDGSAIYAVEGKNLASRGRTSPLGETLAEARIVLIPLNGAPRTVAALPSAEVGGVSMSADGRRFVFTAYSSRSDVWVVDDFDASPRPHRIAMTR